MDYRGICDYVKFVVVGKREGPSRCSAKRRCPLSGMASHDRPSSLGSDGGEFDEAPGESN